MYMLWFNFTLVKMLFFVVFVYGNGMSLRQGKIRFEPRINVYPQPQCIYLLTFTYVHMFIQMSEICSDFLSDYPVFHSRIPMVFSIY